MSQFQTTTGKRSGFQTLSEAAVTLLRRGLVWLPGLGGAALRKIGHLAFPDVRRGDRGLDLVACPFQLTNG